MEGGHIAGEEKEDAKKNGQDDGERHGPMVCSGKTEEDGRGHCQS